MRIAIIGGGLDMLTLPEALNEWCNNVDCYLVQRHADELVKGKPLKVILNELKISNFTVKDELDFQGKIRDKQYDLVFGLGPAWVISEETLRLAKKWVNINSIPLPKYMGGAHSTWQLLNDDNSGSIVFQEIGFPVDQGKILARFNFKYTDEHYYPELRMQENSKQILLSLKFAMDKIMRKSQDSLSYIDISQTEHWPRLSTAIHGWIDWRWSSSEIVRFIHAFGEPFEGAKTELIGHVVYFRQANIIDKGSFHPFGAGTIIRHQSDEQIDVVSSDGIIRVNAIIPEALHRNSIRGLRFHTSVDKLETAKKTNLFSKDM